MRRSATPCRSPTSFSSWRRRTTGPTCSASTASPARWRRSSTSELAPPPGADPEPAGDEPVTDQDRRSRRLPAVHRPPVQRRHGRAVAALAQGSARRGGHASDLERRRRDELRHARARQPAARVRLRHARRRADRRPAREEGRAHEDARRAGARARAGGSPDHGRGTADRHRRDHGRRGDRGLRVDDVGAAGGGELRARRHHALVRAAAPALGGVEPLGEGRGPGGGAAGRALRHRAARLAHRCPLDGPRRRARGAAASGDDRLQARARRRGHRARDRGGGAAPPPRAPGVRGRRRLGRARSHVAGR